MMDCDDIQTKLSEWIDGTLDEPTTVTVRTHLQDCEECQNAEQHLANVDTELKSLVAADRDRSLQIADRVLQELPALDRPASQQAAAATKFGGRLLPGALIGYLLAAAAGFLVAAVWFRPPAPEAEQIATAPPAAEVIRDPDESLPDVAVSPAAHLVRATGNVSFRPTAADDWTSVTPANLTTFACPSDGCVRTEPGVLCELETATGSRVRLNESSEIKLLANDELQLVRGQVWCKASDNATLKVVTGDDDGNRQPHEPIWSMACSPTTELFTSCKPTEPLKVMAASGTVDVRMNGIEQNLEPGKVCTIADGKVEIRQSYGDVLVEERWMQPLLTLSGHGNPELTRRVDALLAQIGRTKISHLYEQDLRSLGEYGALPLLKFTVADESANEPIRRRMAMKIVADTAPVWMVPDFIGLLEDDDPEVRFYAASGLARLTGESHGLSPEDWRGNESHLADGIERWQAWWQQNRLRCPVPPTSTWSIAP